jgi:DNA-binding GntR family transcriptional regulator
MAPVWVVYPRDMDDPRKYRKVYSVLRERIEDGTYPPASAMPPLGALAYEFDVANDTVQHALHKLSEDGLVERWPGLGYHVR